MEMDIQIQCAAEALDQRGCAGLCRGFCTVISTKS